MKPSIFVLLPLLTFALWSPASVDGADDEASPGGSVTGSAGALERETPERVIKTDREWAKLLTRDQFLVTRLKGTEPAYSGRYLNHHGRGVYACVCCGAGLFDSRTKFRSGTGWPSFYQPLSRDTLSTEMDYRNPEVRVEVMCRVCNAHLGHVFNDGPRPTGLRYCINSLALKFVPWVPEPAKSDPKPESTEAPEASDATTAP